MIDLIIFVVYNEGNEPVKQFLNGCLDGGDVWKE